MKIIFLDMDGVMNSDKFNNRAVTESDAAMTSIQFGLNMIDPEAVKLLDKIVDASGAKIVISSSWRIVHSVQEIASMLAQKGFKNSDAIIDKTGRSPRGFRGDEIRQWLGLERERKVVDPEHLMVQSYVILDDSTDFHTDQQDHFVRTDPMVGLTPSDARKALQILSRVA